MRVLLITGAGPCGIAEHGAYLAEAVRAAGVEISVAKEEALDPKWFFHATLAPIPEVVHRNYHAALHSRWTPEQVHRLRAHAQVVITYHDTGVPNSDQCKALHVVADAFVVHEPADDLPGAHYWRQGIPDWSFAWKWPWPPTQPTVGTVGFPFAWKNFDLLCEAAAIAGWRVVLMAPGATAEDVTRWERLARNRVLVRNDFAPRDEVVARLTGCDATAFLYNTHNTGTSGAIRQGIAARKPLIASQFPAGRQFRDLQFDPLGARAITWIEPNLENVVAALSQVRIAPVDAGMVALAERDSWANVGKKYAALYRELGAK